MINKLDVDMKECVGAIDLGTNSSRLLIVDKNLEPVFRDVRHVALGEKLAETGKFCDIAMERAICSFMDFKEMMEIYNVKKYRAIATAACRISNNTKDFIEDIKKSSGLDIDVISEYEEARLTLKGASLNASKDKKYLFVYDLGGGSTEVTLALNGESPEILETVSIPLGARNATEMFKLANYNKKGAEALEREVHGYMNDFMNKIKKYDYKDNAVLVATSSTPLRLAAWISKMPTYDKFMADGVTVKISELDDVIKKILPMSYFKRAKSVYIGRCRAKIFVAALIIFRKIYREIGLEELTASLKSAQEAIVAELWDDADKGYKL
jgi:exopolyphosphatase/guanosine-5'-triphosphate,3'-diphosphate pyrophosphatase